MAQQNTGFCKVPDSVTGREGARYHQWPIGHVITWTIVRSIPRFSAEDLRDVMAQAWQAWMDVCGVRLEYVSNASRANILIGSRSIDGQLGVLAEAELPVGNITPASQLRMWFDIGEQFVVADNPPPGTVPLLTVAIHEGGHNLGLGHNMDGITNAIMDPSISHIKLPQAWDINEAVLRYGEPQRDRPDEPTPGDTSDDLETTLEAILNCVRQMTPNQRAAVTRLLSQKFGSVLNIRTDD